jgi:hypothetical protein
MARPRKVSLNQFARVVLSVCRPIVASLPSPARLARLTVETDNDNAISVVTCNVESFSVDTSWQQVRQLVIDGCTLAIPDDGSVGGPLRQFEQYDSGSWRVRAFQFSYRLRFVVVDSLTANHWHHRRTDPSGRITATCGTKIHGPICDPALFRAAQNRGLRRSSWRRCCLFGPRHVDRTTARE